MGALTCVCARLAKRWQHLSQATRLAVKLAVVTYGIGLVIVWGLWGWLQGFVPYFPEWMKVWTAQLSFWGIYASVGLMTFRALPSYHRLRIVLNLVGAVAFLINLLLEKNSGNVALAVCLILLRVWSLWRNPHQPLKKGWWKRTLMATVILVTGYAFSQKLIGYWPVDATTQYPGWGWSWIALAGAVLFVILAAALEARAMKGEGLTYNLLFWSGDFLFLLSYLGEYNWSGLSQDIAFLFMLAVAAVIKLLAAEKG